jgi:type IV pilus assembly protein PilP
MKRAALAAAIACLALAGCGERHLDEVKEFVKNSDTTLKPGRVPPLPEVKPYEPFTYNAYDLTDPFKPRQITPPKVAGGEGTIKPPPADRRKEPLEAYPLENLRMVGTLQQKKEIYAVVKTPDNRLFRVRPGNYLGQNFGRITGITESSIKLKEIIQDGGGDWKEEEKSLQLQEG